MAARLADVLSRNRTSFAAVIRFLRATGSPFVFDFTDANADLTRVDVNDSAGFTEYLFGLISDAELPVGIGRYNENRVLYRHSPLFDGESERRSVHLGIDLFVIEGTEVFAPLAATVHSFADNTGIGNYGPTLVLAHELDETSFYTLYGHLGRDVLGTLRVGRRFAPGERIGFIGDLHENGGWPPHLHFQVISDLLGHHGDFPGVASLSEREYYLELCPDPNLILGIDGL